MQPTRKAIRSIGPLGTIAGALKQFTILPQLNDSTAAAEVLQLHLLPLLQADPKDLSVDLRKIQDMLRKHHLASDENN